MDSRHAQNGGNMHTQRGLVSLILLAGFVLSACGSAPIPGIDEPITVNGIEVQIKSAQLGGDLPEGYQLTSGDDVVLEIDITFSDTEAANDLREEIVVVDEGGNETHVSLSVVQFSSESEEALPHQFFFAVRTSAKQFSLRFPDGQVIDLMPLLADS
jgi:hypothetical protein